ncbi:MAG: dihydrofolate reductase family protein [Mariprofundaceae bacterium]
MTILRLYPAPVQAQPLSGTYLDFGLHARDDVFIYANYIASLDGRIAMPEANGEQGVPAALANPRDWRLYQELAAQSDIMLTSARYFRQLAKGNAQDLLPVGSQPDFSDLRDWRRANGLKSQPDVAIVSASLDIPQTALEKISDRRIMVLTTEHADDGRVAALEALGINVVIAGAERVEGGILKRTLVADGYKSAYMIAGPGLHATLVAAGVLDYLFLTTRYMLLAGDDFSSIMQGDLDMTAELELLSRYHDVDGQQDFACYRFKNQSTV